MVPSRVSEMRGLVTDCTDRSAMADLSVCLASSRTAVTPPFLWCLSKGVLSTQGPQLIPRAWYSQKTVLAGDFLDCPALAQPKDGGRGTEMFFRAKRELITLPPSAVSAL